MSGRSPLPIAVFNSNENHMGLHKWARVISDNLVHVSVIKFQRRPAYKEVFAHEDKLIQDHNVAMVHDEFVDNLLLNLNPLLEKYGGGGGHQPGPPSLAITAGWRRTQSSARRSAAFWPTCRSAPPA